MRSHNWHIDLSRFIEERRNRPFSWGEHDCCLFCADAAVLVCGTDPAAPYRGKYNDEQSAWQALQDYGDGTIAGAWSSCFSEIEVIQVQRGDVCLFDVNPAAELPQARHACALSFGSKLWFVTPGDGGLRTLPLSYAVKAWRVE